MRKNSLIPAICGLILIISLGAKAQDAGSEEVTICPDSIPLFGTLLIPSDGFTGDVVFIISGSGPTDRNGNNPMMVNNSLKLLAEALSNYGIASLRVDKRGVAKSSSEKFSESGLLFDTYIADANAWVGFLANDKRLKSITIIGHSEGALIGTIAAQDAKVDRLVCVSGAGRPAANVIQEQVLSQMPDLKPSLVQTLDSLEAGYLVRNTPPFLNSLFRPSVQPYLISWFKYDPASEVGKVSKPVLIIQGTTDIQVSTDDAERMASKNERVELKIIEGMNHVFREVSVDRTVNMATYGNASLPIMVELSQTIEDFMAPKTPTR